MTFNIIQRFGATIMAMAGFIIPLAALLLGVLMLNETVTPVMALGILMIFSGLFLVVRKPR
jgi:drug/metabolite transporter (DMT)-like permease